MSRQASPERRLGGGLLVTAGTLILLLSGLCTALLGVPFTFSEYGDPSLVLIMLAVDTPAIVVGAGLIMLGRRIGWPKPETDGKRRGLRRFLALALMLVGAAAAFLGILTILGVGKGSDTVVGGLIAAAIGAGLVEAGRRLWRDQAIPPSEDAF